MFDWERMAWEYSVKHLNGPELEPGQECPVCKGLGYVTAAVPAGHPLQGKAIPCYCARGRIRGKLMAKLREGSGMSEEQMEHLTFSEFDPNLCEPASARPAMTRIKKLCMSYAASLDGWLVLVGPYGSGKTHLACAIARLNMSNGKGVYVGTLPDILDRIRKGYKTAEENEWIDRVKAVDLLIMDDLGAQKKTDWATEKLYQIINHRYVDRLPLVVTSNVYPHEADIEPRVASRLAEGSQAVGGWSKVVYLPCTDIRPKLGGKR